MLTLTCHDLAFGNEADLSSVWGGFAELLRIRYAT